MSHTKSKLERVTSTNCHNPPPRRTDSLGSADEETRLTIAATRMDYDPPSPGGLRRDRVENLYWPFKCIRVRVSVKGASKCTVKCVRVDEVKVIKKAISTKQFDEV